MVIIMSNTPYETVVHEYHIGPDDARLLECVRIKNVTNPMSVRDMALFAALTQGRPDILKGSGLIADADGGLVVTPYGERALNFFYRMHGRNSFY